MIWNCFMVGLGGFVGSILRYLVGLLPLDTGNGFPIKTFYRCFSAGLSFGMLGKACRSATPGSIVFKGRFVWWIYDVFHLCL